VDAGDVRTQATARDAALAECMPTARAGGSCTAWRFTQVLDWSHPQPRLVRPAIVIGLPLAAGAIVWLFI
jgi:hypothetical protein